MRGVTSMHESWSQHRAKPIAMGGWCEVTQRLLKRPHYIASNRISVVREIEDQTVERREAQAIYYGAFSSLWSRHLKRPNQDSHRRTKSPAAIRHILSNAHLLLHSLVKTKPGLSVAKMLSTRVFFFLQWTISRQDEVLMYNAIALRGDCW